MAIFQISSAAVQQNMYTELLIKILQRRSYETTAMTVLPDGYRNLRALRSHYVSFIKLSSCLVAASRGPSIWREADSCRFNRVASIISHFDLYGVRRDYQRQPSFLSNYAFCYRGSPLPRSASGYRRCMCGDILGVFVSWYLGRLTDFFEPFLVCTPGGTMIFHGLWLLWQLRLASRCQRVSTEFGVHREWTRQ